MQSLFSMSFNSEREPTVQIQICMLVFSSFKLCKTIDPHVCGLAEGGGQEIMCCFSCETTISTANISLECSCIIVVEVAQYHFILYSSEMRHYLTDLARLAYCAVVFVWYFLFMKYICVSSTALYRSYYY